MVAMLLYGLFIAIFGIQLVYLVGFGYFFPARRTWPTPVKFPGVSILIAAKNEHATLSSNLVHILQQEYPTFEVIVINDASTDNSLSFLTQIQKDYPHLKCINLPPSADYTGNKKNALRQGIQAAQYDQLLFTDADCTPNSTHWIHYMMRPLQTSKDLVLGYGGYQKSGSFLNKLIRYETLLTAIQYFSYAEMGLPYMGVGRNLAYTKSLLTEEPYASHQHLQSGDDDLLVNTYSTAQNTATMIDPKSFTYSAPKKTIKAWITQKRRHYTTANHYKTSHQFLLGLFFGSQFLFWILAIILLSMAFNWFSVISLVLIRLAIQYLSYRKAVKKLKEVDLIPFLPILDFSLVIVQLYCGILNLISKPKNW